MGNEKKNTTNIDIDHVPIASCGLCGCEIDVAGLDPFVKIECPDCGHLETVPGRFGQFLLLELLGTGGMGAVYRAKDVALGRLVGLKVMLASVGEDKEFIDTFRREAQAAARINHPHIAQIYSFGQEKGQPFIVMELVTGKHFDEMVENEHPLRQALVMQVGVDIAEGLQVADEIGLLHGDIKPENILLDEKMNAKLVDFGIASFSKQGAKEGIWGTPYYIAPEKIKRQKVDARSDIYSLGATLYHALAAKPPFEGDTPIEVVKARLERPPTPLHSHRKDIHPKVESVIDRMLEVEPSRRYPNYASLISDMQRALAELGGTPRTVHKGISRKSRKIVVAKRTSAEQTVSAAPLSDRHRAIKVQKTSRVDAVPTQSAIEKYKNQAKEANEPEKKSHAVLWTFLILLLLLLIGGGVAFALHIKEKQEIERQIMLERSALQNVINDAGKAYASIELSASNVTVIAESSQTLTTKAADAVLVVLGVSLETSSQPVADDAPNAAPAETAAPTTTQQQAPAQQTEMQVSADAPPDGLTREQLEAQRKGIAPPAQPNAEPMAAEQDQPEVADDPEIKKLAQKVISANAKIQNHLKNTQSILASALSTKTEIEGSTSSTHASSKIILIQKEADEIVAIEKKAQEILADIEKKAAEIEAIRTNIDQEKEAQMKAQEEENAKRQAEEDARRQAEELAALIKNEMALLETSRSINDVLVKQNKFKEASDALKAQKSGYKTEEGKNALSLQIERYDRLHNLKVFLTERLNSDPFLWGYGKGTSARDILSASEKGLKIKGSDTIVPWETIDAAQMMSFFKRYLTSKKAKIRSLGEANLGAAIFCYETARENEYALRAAKAFAAQAIDYCDDLKSQASKLLPFE